MLAQNYPLNSYICTDASKCIEQIRSGLSESAFGFKVQALAGHVLLRLGYRIVEINSSGHPDIVACRDGRTFYFEVEAEVATPRLRKLTAADLGTLTNAPGVVGYYALAASVPTPRWLLVPAAKLTGRARSSSKALLEALSDKAFSAAWTWEYVRLLHVACRQIKLASFNALCERALAGCSVGNIASSCGL